MIQFIKDYFETSKFQAIAIIALCIITLLIASVSFVMPHYGKKIVAEPVSDSLRQFIAENILLDTSSKSYTKYTSRQDFKKEKHKLTPFVFDPNTLNEAGFLKLGLPEYTVKTILNYRNKGGKFYDIEDMQKMYSLSEPDFEALKAFIKIPKTANRNNFSKNTYEKKVVHFELNKADTSELNLLKGIGSAFAFRIVEYRNKIGGYYSINQLKEVYGISDSLLTQIRNNLSVDKTQIKRININEVTFQSLGEHPYFRNGIALAICKYRKNKATKIENISELESIPECNSEILEKIKNYITF